GVALRILNFGGDAVDTRGAAGRLMLNMFAAMAQFEREMMLERQREGIARAKAQGKYKGRKPTARAKAQDALRLFREGKWQAASDRDPHRHPKGTPSFCVSSGLMCDHQLGS